MGNSTNNNYTGNLNLSVEEIEEMSLEDNFIQIPGIAGATILGDGRVSFILDVPSLLN